jgi:hypothetical protein
MGFTHILTHYVTTSLFYLCLFPNNFYSSSTRTCSWLHNVHILKVTYFSVYAPSLVIFRKDISSWCNIKRFAIKSSHALNISPHQIFSSDAPAAGKMVYMLKLVYVLYSISFKKTRPKYIPGTSGTYKMKTCHFKCIYNTVVSMSRIMNLKTELLSRA